LIYVWVRQTVDWQDEQAFVAQLDPRFTPKVELWNETFGIPYHHFRHRVREIAQLNLSRVEGARCADWEEIPQGALVIPIDDDDWLAPNAVEVLSREFDPGVPGYRWIASWIEIPTTLGHRIYLIRRRILPWSPEKWVCSSNNYAIVKDADTKPLLASHLRASRWVESAAAESVKRIDRRLSLINRTLASQTALLHPSPSLSRSQLIRRFRRYKTLYDRPTSPELAWSRPYRALMSELMDRLRLRAA
jgi:hypothetical protein